MPWAFSSRRVSGCQPEVLCSSSGKTLKDNDRQCPTLAGQRGLGQSAVALARLKRFAAACAAEIYGQSDAGLSREQETFAMPKAFARRAVPGDHSLRGRHPCHHGALLRRCVQKQPDHAD